VWDALAKRSSLNLKRVGMDRDERIQKILELIKISLNKVIQGQIKQVEDSLALLSYNVFRNEIISM